MYITGLINDWQGVPYVHNSTTPLLGGLVTKATSATTTAVTYAMRTRLSVAVICLTSLLASREAAATAIMSSVKRRDCTSFLRSTLAREYVPATVRAP
ncbi:MAG: hypothetical protein QXS00_01090 [Pyrobaculum sp.]